MQVFSTVKMCVLLFGWGVVALPAWAQEEQACRSNVQVATPDSDFIVDEDGTATHLPTGLMWMRCALGQDWNGETCIGEAMGMNWPQALQAAKDHDFAEYTDWRLPNYKELDSIQELACFYPSINLTVFPNTPASNLTVSPDNAPSQFWSSSTFSFSSGGMRILVINFSNSQVNLNRQSEPNRVRLVRGGVQP